MSVLIVPDGESEMLLTSEPADVGIQSPSEIGTHKLELDAEICNELHALAEAAQNASPAAPPPIPAGVRLLAFGIGEKDDVDDVITFLASKTLPPAVEKFDKRMQAVAGQMKAHRYQTLRAAASWKSLEFSPNDELKLTLNLENSGIVPIAIPNPAAANDDEEVGLILFLQSDLPPDRVSPESRAFFPVKAGEAAQLAAPGWKAGDPLERLVTLDPGERLELAITVRRQIYLIPGPYSGWVTYEAEHEKIPDHLALEGTVRTRIGAFQVTIGTGG